MTQAENEIINDGLIALYNYNKWLSGDTTKIVDLFFIRTGRDLDTEGLKTKYMEHKETK